MGAGRAKSPASGGTAIRSAGLNPLNAGEGQSLGDATGARSEPPCQVVLYYKTHLAVRFSLLRGFVLQRSHCITTACTTPKTAQSTVAHHLIETVGDFRF